MSHTRQIAERRQKARERDARDLRALELYDQGMSQAEVAEVVGCSQQHVSDLVREAME